MQVILKVFVIEGMQKLNDMGNEEVREMFIIYELKREHFIIGGIGKFFT